MVKRGGRSRIRGKNSRGGRGGRGPNGNSTGGRADDFKQDKEHNGRGKRGKRGGRKEDKPDVGKLDDQLDNYWLKSGNENVKEKIKKENHETLNVDLDKYWEQKDKPKADTEAPVEETKE